MIKIGLDAMGGDFGLDSTIEGSLLAVKNHSDIHIVLYGDSEQINKRLKTHPRISVVHTTQVLDMGEKDPIKAIRSSKDSSLVVALKEGKENKVDAVVSSGPTQCIVAGAHLIVKRMPNMSRVAICPIIPSMDGRGRLLLDVGANIELRPEHINDLAIAAYIVSKEVLGNKNPQVALLNIGSEPGKGREQEIETFRLLEENKSLNFFGNLEPKEILTSEADIFITDGFTGNMILKTIEGTAKTMGAMLKKEIKSSPLSIFAALLMKKKLNNFKKRLDASEIGGAMILGINIPLIKAHGSSNAKAISNAIRQAKIMVENDIINKVANNLPKKRVDTSE